MVIIRQKDLDNKNNSKRPRNITSKGSLQRSINWSDVDHEWLGENFSSIEIGFYFKKLYQINIKGQEMKTYQGMAPGGTVPFGPT